SFGIDGSLLTCFTGCLGSLSQVRQFGLRIYGFPAKLCRPFDRSLSSERVDPCKSGSPHAVRDGAQFVAETCWPAATGTEIVTPTSSPPITIKNRELIRNSFPYAFIVAGEKKSFANASAYFDLTNLLEPYYARNQSCGSK